jgi:protein tyrosine phosphatase (PTP) superfamily phosphohydrolase (DUF442 family)
VLDHLPPLDLPSDVTEKNTTPPVAPAAQRKPQTPALASDHQSGRSSRESDLTLTGSSLPGPETASSAGGVPGISRFVAVDLKLAGGSAPSTAGLDWLADKGYKTLVDLRESSETDLLFIAQATQRGLRYIALPVSRETINRPHIARFNFELALGDARPLYFFDTDGTRAGALWYIRRITVDRLSSQIARREAEELGLSNQDYWLAATSYLEHLDNPRSQVSEASGPVSTAGSEKTAKPAPQAPRPPASESGPPAPAGPADPSKKASQAQAVVSPAGTASLPAAEPPVQEARASGEIRSRASSGPAAPTPAPTAQVDTTAWHPFAALMMITGLTFPLAYWSRSLVPTILARARASLPAPARRLKSLPRESDV